ncbi:MAG TPA: peptidase M20 [Acidimicrobiaceae bacterium]|nr:peptidase M20 [Acidimicrobiaceae bacterium]
MSHHTDAAERVLQQVEALREPLVAELAAVVRIPSEGGCADENEAQAHMAGLLGGYGLEVDHWQVDLAALTARDDFPGMEVERSEAWGVVGRLPGSGDGANLMLNGHIDVVPTGDPDAWEIPPYDAVVREGRMYGRGTCDMKAGLMASVFAVRAIREAGVRLRGDLLLASVLGEEDGGLGTYATLQRGWRADACVIAEPTDMDIIPANSGALTFRLRVRGKATHAARRTEGVSAIEKFWPVWHAIADLEARRHVAVDPRAARWPLAHPISIGSVRCGDWASSVPDLLVAEGRMGVAIGEDVADARAALEEAVADACAADTWLRAHPVEVEWWGGQFASGSLPESSDLVQRVQAVHHTASGGAPLDVYAAPYGSDLRLLTGLGGIPTLQYGPGDAMLAHGPQESVPLEEVFTTARTLALLALDICGVS